MYAKDLDALKDYELPAEVADLPSAQTDLWLYPWNDDYVLNGWFRPTAKGDWLAYPDDVEDE